MNNTNDKIYLFLLKLILVLILSISLNLFLNIFNNNLYVYNLHWDLLNLLIILISAFFWNEIGAISYSLVYSILKLPNLPFETRFISLNLWIIQLCIYLIFSIIVGFFLRKGKKFKSKEFNLKYKDSFTNLYNSAKLNEDITKLISRSHKFNLVFIELLNFEEFSKHYDITLVKKIILKKVLKATRFFDDIEIYSYSYNKFVYIIKNEDINIIKEKLSTSINLLNKSNNFINNIIKVIIKVGIIEYEGDQIEAKELIYKARTTSDQGSPYESGVFIFNPIHINTRYLQYEIAASLNNAIKNNDFYLVYQPIIDLKKNKVFSCEALLRWDRAKKPNIGPDFFIKVAEESGHIIELTKCVIKNAISDYIEWTNEGYDIKPSINITKNELINDSFLDWVENEIEKNNIKRQGIGIEITERVFEEDIFKLNKSLSLLQKKGYLIEIDDFGTGFNSLLVIGNIPIDIIKIDKYFVSRIHESKINTLIKKTIEAIHEIGASVIAEGVETKEQFHIMKELGCDKIQGYYFSKPLLKEQLKEFINNFNITNFE